MEGSAQAARKTIDRVAEKAAQVAWSAEVAAAEIVTTTTQITSTTAISTGAVFNEAIAICAVTHSALSPIKAA